DFAVGVDQPRQVALLAELDVEHRCIQIELVHCRVAELRERALFTPRERKPGAQRDHGCQHEGADQRRGAAQQRMTLRIQTRACPYEKCTPTPGARSWATSRAAVNARIR